MESLFRNCPVAMIFLRKYFALAVYIAISFNVQIAISFIKLIIKGTFNVDFIRKSHLI